MAGTSQSALARYENGASQPTLPTLERILTACGRQLKIEAAHADAFARPSSVRGMLGPHAALLRQNRTRLLEAAERHGASQLRAFGSIAKGEATPESDIDLLVDLKPGRTLVDLLAFRQEAEVVLDLPVDVATPDMLKDEHRDHVLAEALPL